MPLSLSLSTNFVWIPNAQVAATTVLNLQVEAEESSTKTSNAIMIWQITNVFSEEHVMHQKAYILFYAQKGIPSFSSIIKGDDEEVELKLPEESDSLHDDDGDEEEKHDPGGHDEIYDDDHLDALNDSVEEDEDEEEDEEESSVNSAENKSNIE